MLATPKVFLSYATPDRDRVLEVYQFLIMNGYKDTWIDCQNILPGQNWDFEIKRNLQKADFVLVFFSKNSVNRRGYVQREIKIVLKKLEEKLIDDIYAIPVKLDTETDIPELLADRQYLDLNSSNALIKLKASLDEQAQILGFETTDVTDSSEPIDETETIDDVKITTISFAESWDGIPGYEVEYSFPSFYSDTYKNIAEISKIIEASLIIELQSHRWFKIEQIPDLYNWTQSKYLRTSTFDASYGTIFRNNNILSFHYTIHWYGAGAAHPNYYFKTYNFLLEPLLQINTLQVLFEDDPSNLEQLIRIVREKLVIEFLERLNENPEEPITKLDEYHIESINEGTQGWNELSCFTFSDKGITIYFSPYQVAAYVLGAFTIDISYKELPDCMKRIFRDTLPIYRF